MSTSYAPLHLHTTFSFLDGHGRLEVYAKRAAELGLPAMATTDHGNIHNWLSFYETARDQGVKPILGIEAYQARKTRHDQDEEERAGRANDELEQRGPYHLTVLARNETGYRNLIKLSSRSWLEGYYGKPRVDHELLSEHADGLIILSGCLNGEIQQALLRDDFDFALKCAGEFQEMVGKDHFYIEMMDHGIPEQELVKEPLLRIAQQLRAPIVCTNDSHYVHQNEAKSHDVMLCVSTGSSIQEENRFKFACDQFFLKSAEEMAAVFPEEWMKNTLRVAESVELELAFGQLYFPEFPLPEGTNVEQVLDEKVWAGLTRRYGDPLPEPVLLRARHELDVVKRMGFPSYFLVVADIVNWARDNGIRVGPGRGSAAGSIMSYALGITGLEPLRFGLMFERFLVEGRKSMPDIDLDFDDENREKVTAYIRQKYGSDRVAQIATFNVVGARQAIRDAARVLGCDYQTGDTLAKLVPEPIMGFSKSLEESLQTQDLAAAYKKDPTNRMVIDAARGLEGLVRQSGIHAAGVVISQAPSVEFVPVMQKGQGEPIICQWDMDGVELCGQLKIDLLGLRNIRVIDVCLKLVQERRGENIDIELVPYNDMPTFKMLCAGHSQGVFQLESPAMRELMLGLQPDCIEDLMALVSLYRPGPLGSGLDKAYVKRKHGREPIVYDHPALEGLLKETYGIILYQEQVLSVARELAGFAPGEADDLRKAIGKKQVEKIPLFRAAFVEGTRKHHHVSSTVSNKIYSDIEHFGGYGFGRAHAASYALIAYWTAYLKTHYPAEYMAALLTSVSDKKDRMVPYLRECKRMGIRVRPPHLDNSEAHFRVMADDEILFGLQGIDGIGPAVISKILDIRKGPYTSLYEFFRRCPPEILDKSTIERLIGAGAVDHLAPGALHISRLDKGEVLEVERKYLSAYVTEHPLSACWIFLEPQVSSTIEGLAKVPANQRVTLAGVMSSVQKKRKKNSDIVYYHFELEDMTGRIDVVVFPRDAEKLDPVEGEIVLIDGRLARDGDDENSALKLFFEGSRVPELPEDVGGPPIRLVLSAKPSVIVMRRLAEVVRGNPGDSPLYVEYVDGSHRMVIRYNETVSSDAEGLLRRTCVESV
jgi:DNA polymerase-3 subunit alpha